jgi:hypothetical protein
MAQREPEKSVSGAIALIHRLQGKFAVPALSALSALKFPTPSTAI